MATSASARTPPAASRRTAWTASRSERTTAPAATGTTTRAGSTRCICTPARCRRTKSAARPTGPAASAAATSPREGRLSNRSRPAAGARRIPRSEPVRSCRGVDVLDAFHPLVAGWFRERFGAPTEPQRAGWPKIAARHDVLIAAPTGSGKTLAAFLACMDELVQRGLDRPLGDHTAILYV